MTVPVNAPGPSRYFVSPCARETTGTAKCTISAKISTMIAVSMKDERSASMMSVSARTVSTMTFELSMQRLAALLELVFVLESRVEAFEVGPVPQHVGLVLDRDAAGNAVLHAERLPDQPQHFAPVAHGPSVLRKDIGERLDLVEHAVDLALVAAERHAFRQRVGENQKTLVRQILQRDRAAGHDAVLALAADRQDGDFVLLAQRGRRRCDP